MALELVLDEDTDDVAPELVLDEDTVTVTGETVEDTVVVDTVADAWFVPPLLTVGGTTGSR